MKETQRVEALNEHQTPGVWSSLHACTTRKLLYYALHVRCTYIRICAERISGNTSSGTPGQYQHEVHGAGGTPRKFDLVNEKLSAKVAKACPKSETEAQARAEPLTQVQSYSDCQFSLIKLQLRVRVRDGIYGTGIGHCWLSNLNLLLESLATSTAELTGNLPHLYKKLLRLLLLQYCF